MLVKDLQRIQKNGRKVLISLLKRHFDPRKTQATLERIALKGTPFIETNNNYWANKVSKFIRIRENKMDLDFEKFAKLGYKELYNESVGNLKSAQAKGAYKQLKNLS